MNRNVSFASRHRNVLIETNKVLRNTYLLLGMTFMFSSLIAYLAFIFNVQPLNPLLMIFGVYGLMFLTNSLRHSSLGLLSVFAFTGFLGYSLGPTINYYVMNFANGYHLVNVALGGTGVIFFALSGYVLVTRKDFNFLSGFLFVSTMVSFLFMIVGVVFHIQIIELIISSLFILLSSGLILFQTSEIVYGGETNYIMATLSLYVSIYNLFISILSVLGFFTSSSNKE
ncbi:Bax inhibitor-1/YccA family protein [Candidatus Legionella polyplacis]|uniref:Bax inhibitor-1/YccA family protein n=1 Tax=Candidatus Legionella polyplacis TaxID=2005262 RepID=A0ABZ2H0E5_9GAMM